LRQRGWNGLAPSPTRAEGAELLPVHAAGLNRSTARPDLVLKSNADGRLFSWTSTDAPDDPSKIANAYLRDSPAPPIDSRPDIEGAFTRCRPCSPGSFFQNVACDSQAVAIGKGPSIVAPASINTGTPLSDARPFLRGPGIEAASPLFAGATVASQTPVVVAHGISPWAYLLGHISLAGPSLPPRPQKVVNPGRLNGSRLLKNAAGGPEPSTAACSTRLLQPKGCSV
jgi:hypothetical protein